MRLQRHALYLAGSSIGEAESGVSPDGGLVVVSGPPGGAMECDSESLYIAARSLHSLQSLPTQSYLYSVLSYT